MARRMELDTTVLDGIIKHLDSNVAEAVAKVAFAVEGRAKINAPVDTGALRASIYTSLKGSNRFDDAKTKAIARSNRRNGAGRVQLLENGDFAPLPIPKSDAVAYVGPSVEYGAAVELGSVKRGGTPYLLPAMRQVENEMRKELSKAVSNGK